ncbi:DMT family transporter [Nioella nitratireducens]|uniref:DMT family transporter n=1 Tax=Nioella nitratireducens TaxID=1287720 RepID=UPI0008FD5501|nr:DMT family transporter [Nioella nitratireducens]
MNLKGALFALLAFAIFATHDVVIKYLGATYEAPQIIFFSVLFSFPLIVFILLRDSEGGSLRPVHPWWTAARTISSAFGAGGAFYAFSVLPLTQVYPILFAMPLLITIFAIPILGERVGIHRALAVIVGLVGVIVVLQPRTATLSPGHFAALGAAVFSAFASIVMRKIGREERTVVLQLYPLIVNFLVMGALLPFVYVPMQLVDLGASAVVASFAMMATACLVMAYRLAPAVIVAPMQYSQIIWASIFGALFFGETLDRPTVIGTGIIIASGLYIVLREDRRSTGSKQPVLRTRTRVGTPSSPRIAAFLRRNRPE